MTAGTLLVDSSVLSSKTTGSGNGGAVRIQVADAMSVLNDSYVGSSSSGAADAGGVSVSAGTLLIDNSGLASDITGSGRGGAVSVQVAGAMKVQNQSYVSSDSFPEFDEGNLGDGGDVTVKAGRLLLDSSNITSVTVGTGRGGAVNVQVVGEMKASNRSGVGSLTFGSGNAGTTLVTAGNLLIDDSVISSDTFGNGRAGTVRVQIAGDMTVQNQSAVSSSTRSTGNAGSVDVRVAGSIQVLSGSYVSSSTVGPGNAGDVSVTTGSLLIDPKGNNLGLTVIDSASIWTEGVSLYPSGDAGRINIRVAGELAVLNGGVISSGTRSPLGKAGSITISAGQIVIDGEFNYPFGSQSSVIVASAESGSSGKTGSVMVTAAESITIQNKGAISIGNFATVATPEVLTGTTLSVTAPSIFLINDARVSARSTGNIAAGNVAVKFTDQLSINQTSTITTSAVDGNGGSIDILGNGLLTLDRSTITTSVTGASGNAGSVNIAAKTLLMSNGFIQANTAAALASGGTILISADALIPSFGTLLIGGSTPYAVDAVTPGFNVIQAASPTGVSGDISITTPNLDLAGKLAGLKVNLLESGGFSRNPCVSAGASSFAQTGRGGLPPSSFGALASVDPGVGQVTASRASESIVALQRPPLVNNRLGCSTS